MLFQHISLEGVSKKFFTHIIHRAIVSVSCSRSRNSFLLLLYYVFILLYFSCNTI